MLLYIFWHWPDPAQPREDYEASLVAFHRELAAAPAPGLRGTSVHRVSAPWLGAESGYEDWYLVDGFTALGDLNEAAVAPPMRATHDRVAHAAAAGAGALYAVRSGELALDAPSLTWLAKPRGMPYADFYASLPADLPWLLRRQLVFGPAPEFCAAGELPGGLTLAREPVFTSPR